MAMLPDESGEGWRGLWARHWPAATSLLALLLVIGLMARDCARRPPPGSVGVSPLSVRAIQQPDLRAPDPGLRAAGSPTPRPTPTPIPKTRYEGGVAIKLARGVDVGAGVPVALVEVEAMEEAAERAARQLARSLDALVAAVADARAALANARTRSRELALEVEGIHRAAWSEASASLGAAAESPTRRLEDIVRIYRLPFAQPPGVPAGSAEETAARARSMSVELEAAIARAAQDLDEDRVRAAEALPEAERRYREVDRFRPHTERQTKEQIAELKKQIHDNEYAQLQVMLIRTRELVNERLATPTLELERLAAEIDGPLQANVARASERLTKEYPLERNKLFRETLAAATVAEAYADDRGRFRFEVDPGSKHALFCRYVDLTTGRAFVWLSPANPKADNILGIYNALSEQAMEREFPAIASLLYGRGGSDPPPSP
jgi:hypothetical protein